MFRIWQSVNPRGVLVTIGAFLLVLGLLIHFILLGSERFNWLAGPATAEPAGQAVSQPGAKTN